MTFKATNTADHILVVEGETNLPAGAPLKAELRTRDGQVMVRDSAVVSHGKFFFDFDLEGLAALSLYQVNVRFDPQTAPLGVRRATGLWGEAMKGAGVVDKDSRRVVDRNLDILLTVGSKGQDWEGRDFSAMEVSERTRIISKLEQLIEDKPDDRDARMALARAYIADDPRELASGTRAHMLLRELASFREADSIRLQAGKYLAGIDATEAKAKNAVAQRKKDTRKARYLDGTTILPGRSIGGFTLGMSYRVLTRNVKLVKPPDFSDPHASTTVRPAELSGIELTFSGVRRLAMIRTTSSRFKLPEGFGVGNLLQELQEKFGKEAVPTPRFRLVNTRADGRAILRGTVLTNGLEFEIRREIDPVFGLPLDTVEAISVFPSE